MQQETPSGEGELWQIRAEIENAERLLSIWRTHAQFHSGTGFGELIKEVAEGYAHQLESLQRALQCTGS